MIDFGRDLCSDRVESARREWLVTNGMGGYASGTIAGLLTRRYHGVLVAALDPPLGRTLLVSKVDETARYDGRDYPLFANRWAGDGVDPQGFHNLDRFYLDGTTPVWEYTCADAWLEKRIWMARDDNTTYIRYVLRRASVPLALEIKALVNYRDFHGSTHAGNWHMQIEPVQHGLCITAYDGATPFYLLCHGAEAVPYHTWYRNFFLEVEAYRGLDATEDHLHAGTFHATLEPGASLTLALSTEATPRRGSAAYSEVKAHEQYLIEQAHVSGSEEIAPLVLGADQFIVRRPTPADPQGVSVIAGYHWFGDWGRDTMIALPGLTLATGRPDVAARVLRTFAHFVDQGMLPNRFPDAGETPEYNTADATLWYFEAIRAYHAATGDDTLLDDLFPVLQDIIAWHQRGTRYNIRADPNDGLIYAGEEGVQLTWMDARVGDWVVTPRMGKPVELSALWYNGLRAMAAFARRLGKPPEAYDRLANGVKAGFDRFWNAERGFCYDVLDTPYGDDARLRPNQLFAVSLAHSPLSSARQKAIVDVCGRHLVTPHGLRSLAPNEPDYVAHYGGDAWQRDRAYHQGTVWGWLIGPFVAAHRRVYRDPDVARSYLKPLIRHVAGHGVGSVSEIFDAEPPFMPRGCIAQAWSVAEVLRAWQTPLR